ncbi:MAG: Plasmid stabilization system [Candidatus Woesebacteria bacterium GW2011_GWB1_38_5b]|uniref:Plasmid stabilization system n=1 Tax=Candidatus Woesebacteria bacterium GW2011_GWB1_38_5b TaxID=1618569 RepID=A0A0G0K6Q9_9BACT|nr:MAG: Plasmid stabilization system [Candidatus Woesebacteria bacterium GW2011_GWB1_38_5b]
MYTLSASQTFKKQVGKISKQDPILRKKITRVLKILRKNVKHPSLRLHKLSGVDTWSVSVTISTRIIIGIEGKTIYLLEIGKHEEVY